MNMHFVGCKGAGMTALIKIVKSFEFDVSGSDLTLDGHDENNVIGKDIVVYSKAVGEDNVEVAAARQLGIKVYERAEYLGLLAKEFSKSVAVAGTHGKTTTTSLIYSILSHFGATPHIGGEPIFKTEKILTDGKNYFVCEACEYNKSFLHLFPDVAVITNIELDHTDFYKDLNDYISAFKSFTNQSKTIILNGDDRNCYALNCHRAITYGFNRYNDYVAVIDNNQNTLLSQTFAVFEHGRFLSEFTINLSGQHNVYNALAAIAAARKIGISVDIITAGINDFVGVKRRFEKVGESGGALVFTDYAHHPTEIKSVINQVKKAAKNSGIKRVRICFEPHTFSRTKSLLDGFADSLSLADEVVTVPIYSARETPIKGVTSHNIVLSLISSGVKAISFDTYYAANKYFFDTAKQGDLILFLGAGTINKCAENLVNFTE